MPVKPLRRIGAPVGASLSDQLSARTFNDVYGWRREVDAIERERPELIIRDGENILAAVPAGAARLVYGFTGDRAFVDRFPAMFEQLLPRIAKSLDADTVRFRLSYAPARPLVEPVLKRLWFAPRRDWIEFSLDRSTKLPAAPAPSGVRFRDGTADDIPELLRLDAEAFPDTPMDPDALATMLEREDLIVATTGRRAAGFCLYGRRDDDLGWINILAVDERDRGRGLGVALTVRACKRLFAPGAQRVGLTTDDANGPAIRLYRRLGFRQSAAGRDYTRPVDEDAIEKIRASQRGTVIRFGGWR